jgi:hypothetical protein
MVRVKIEIMAGQTDIPRDGFLGSRDVISRSPSKRHQGGGSGCSQSPWSGLAKKRILP